MIMSSGQSFRGGHEFVLFSVEAGPFEYIDDLRRSVSSRGRLVEGLGVVGGIVAVVLAGSWSVGDNMSWLLVMMKRTR